jgi:hypothetical protein
VPSLRSYLCTTEPHLFPWYIGHIYNSGRSVFLSSPQFWSTFGNESTTNPIHRARTHSICLERSKNHPRFFFPEVSLRFQILETLVVESFRWKKMSIFVCFEPTMAVLCRALASYVRYNYYLYLEHFNIFEE